MLLGFAAAAFCVCLYRMSLYLFLIDKENKPNSLLAGLSNEEHNGKIQRRRLTKGGFVVEALEGKEGRRK